MLEKEIIRKVEHLKNMLVARAEGNTAAGNLYPDIRSELMREHALWNRLPEFVHTCRTIQEFWGFIRSRFKTYQERRDFLREQFHPALTFLESLRSSPAPGSVREAESTQNRDAIMERDSKRVFVVYGRNTAAYNAIVLFLQSLRLEPRDFLEVRNELKGAPFIGNIVRAGMDRAQATLVLFTPDEHAFLRPGLDRPNDPSKDRQRWQSRPNVLFEAGMALAIDETRTIPVTLGDVALPSDLDGRHVIRLSNDVAARASLKDALEAAGCDVHQSGKWFDSKLAGDFDACIKPPHLADTPVCSPFSPSKVGGSPSSRSSVLLQLGDMLAERSDLVVFPCSTSGTIASFVESAVRRYRLPRPPVRAELGDFIPVNSPLTFEIARHLAYAVSVHNNDSSEEAIERIGRKLAAFSSRDPSIRTIRVPLLGAGAGGLAPEVAASSLRRGFQSAPETFATLYIHVLDSDILDHIRRNGKLHATQDAGLELQPKLDPAHLKSVRMYAASDPLSQQSSNLHANAPACDVCGCITVRSGTCYKCLNCGNSMGCS